VAFIAEVLLVEVSSGLVLGDTWWVEVAWVIGAPSCWVSDFGIAAVGVASSILSLGSVAFVLKICEVLFPLTYNDIVDKVFFPEGLFGSLQRFTFEVLEYLFHLLLGLTIFQVFVNGWGVTIFGSRMKDSRGLDDFGPLLRRALLRVVIVTVAGNLSDIRRWDSQRMYARLALLCR